MFVSLSIDGSRGAPNVPCWMILHYIDYRHHIRERIGADQLNQE